MCCYCCVVCDMWVSVMSDECRGTWVTKKRTPQLLPFVYIWQKYISQRRPRRMPRQRNSEFRNFIFGGSARWKCPACEILLFQRRYVCGNRIVYFIFGGGALRKCPACEILDFEIIYSAKVPRKSASRKKDSQLKKWL